MNREPFLQARIRDAATVIAARDGTDGLLVYMVRRNAKAAFLPDLYVFPGGAVDPEDRREAASAELTDGVPGADPAFVVAAVRETFEEAGLLFADRPLDPEVLAAARHRLAAGEETFGAMLRRLETRIDVSQMRYFSHWITPPITTHRFDTRFFVARAPDDQVAEADAREVLDGRWFRPLEALAAHERGEIGLIFPTIKHLERIAPYRTVTSLLAFAEEKTILTISPDVNDGGEFSLAREVEAAW
ncbi:MAG TPA: NUDIX hydrolase [Candidatus Acidoferrum sp.]|nr:NUDIX hydrolase [Candidatus Acidoferrum sp.]